MRPIWNPGQGGLTGVKASIRYVTLFDNISQPVFTNRLFERAVRRRKKHGLNELSLPPMAGLFVTPGLPLYLSEKAPLLRKAQKWATPENHGTSGEIVSLEYNWHDL